MVGLQLGELGNQIRTEQSQCLQKVSNSKVDPGDFSSDEVVVSQQSVEFGDERPNLFGEVLLGGLKGGEGMMTVAETHELDVGVPEDSPCSGHSHLLIGVSSHQVLSVGSVADIDADGVALADQFVAVLEIGQIDCWVSFSKEGLELIVPPVAVLFQVATVLGLGVRKSTEFKQLPDALSKSSNVPVAKNNFALHLTAIFQKISNLYNI